MEDRAIRTLLLNNDDWDPTTGRLTNARRGSVRTMADEWRKEGVLAPCVIYETTLRCHEAAAIVADVLGETTPFLPITAFTDEKLREHEQKESVIYVRDGSSER